MSKLKVIVRERIFVPADQVDVQAIRKHYTRIVYDEPACAKCDNKPARSRTKPIADCRQCPGLKGIYKMFIERNGYIGLPVGDKRNFEKVTGWAFSDCRVIDKRVVGEHDYRLKALVPLYPYQEPLVDKMVKAGYGIMDAPPRSGKTAMMTHVAVRMKRVTLMVADQHEFLTQFLDHIYGRGEEGDPNHVPAFTNMKELEKKHGRRLAGIPKTKDDFDNYIIMAMTYQTFLSEKGQRLLRRLAKRVGLILVDEVHSAAADCFSRVVSAFYARSMMGFTGTVERKDGKHIIILRHIGPTMAKSEVEMLPVKVSVHDTKVKYRSKPSSWTYAIRNISKNEKRNDLLVAQAIRDVKKGRSVLIPVYHVAHVHYLVNQINKEYGKKIAEAFTGGQGNKSKLLRADILSRARSGQTRVIVSIRKLTQRGVNVKQWDTLYLAMPISNKPNLRQESARIRTPGVDKCAPLVRVFVDFDFGLVVGCAKNSIQHMQSFGYRMCKDTNTQTLLPLIMSNGRNRGGVDDMDSQFKARMADIV